VTPIGQAGAMFATSVADAVWVLGAVIVVAGLFMLLKRIEPHWVAKDGRAFTCKLQPISTSAGRAEGRWRDARAVISEGQVQLVVRGFGSVSVRPYQRHHVVGRSETPPPRQAVFVLDGEPMWALRVPATSKAVAVLDALISD
jgi:hypothetical protein